MTHSSTTSEDIFECTQCGECCTGFGGTYMTEEDVQRIAAFIGMTPEEFVATRCQIVDGMPVIASGQDGRCVFFKDNCTIHAVKPRMCRAWPFIDAVARVPSNWDLMADACPGIRKGFPHEVIRRIVCGEQEKLNEARHEVGSISPHLRGQKA
ncbi:YkgJ family cysteine cluster protein [Desulfoluna butyratoxydans]|uniref:Putative zinc- or iron-chelating domain containing protein n=1 Tax=Desulfoluna butyratoxydans TaxID=231438 RepID=A0A4U8YL90_9BACT|nr:YkgJ family cysteine cluster protein [Desulfoluna butyratoxydans]VFQ44317.1 putative zinc- or iron-chelating domain containing protein [Desulfoluna butyratoxydans]